MAMRYLLSCWLMVCLLSGAAVLAIAQETEPNIRVTVDLVQLNVAVMDSKGNYVTHLSPSDFAILEDGIPQKIATFGEGNEATRELMGVAKADGSLPPVEPDSADVAGRLQDRPSRTAAETAAQSLG